jgi:uncharacterized damage-inducible protein DinB
MEMKTYLKQMYDYTYWANKRYVAVAEGLSEEQLHRKQGHSWDSVHGVLLHMLSSETRWLMRWGGEAPRGHLAPEDFPTLARVTEKWASVEKELRDFLEAQTEESLEEVRPYINFQGERFQLPLWQMMAHIINHETHHRGELAAMFALMNVPHAEEEVVQYFLHTSGQKRL